ncbi:MAG: helix-turn-helix transcriptional regulator [Desulfobacteraceae bacterium]|nr:helix-turn-helix transcriptional regulator [Desulfobacteraceae bacterium]
MSNFETTINDDKKIKTFSRIFKALSNPNRLKIMLELTSCHKGQESFSASMDADQVENCQQEFARELGLAPSTISHHFKELRRAGLLKIKREGKSFIVWVDKEVVESIRQLF